MTDPVDVLRELNPVSELPPPAIEPLWERLAADERAHDRAHDRAHERAGARAAGGLRPPWRRRPSFGGAMTVAVLAAATVLAVLIVGSLRGTSRGQHSSVPLGPPLPVPHTSTPYGVALPYTVKMLTTQAGPGGGLPWGLRSFRTSSGSLCLQIGRVRNRQLGLLGAGGAFRTMAASPALDAHCGRPGDATIVVAERFAGRTAYFGIVPAGAIGVDYRYGHGRLFELGLTLVPPFVHAPQPYLQLPLRERCSGPRGRAVCRNTSASVPVQVPTTGVSAGLRFFVGEPCPLHSLSAGTAAGTCDVVIPKALTVSRAQVGSPVHVHVARAATFCSPRKDLIALAPCPANPPAGESRTNGAGKVLIVLSFRARVPSQRGDYGWSISEPSGPGCGMGEASVGPEPQLRGGSVERFYTLQHACPGRYRGTVTFTPSNGQASGTAVLVGRYSFVLGP